MDAIHLADLEAAINHWRARQPAGDDGALSPPVAALAEVYARLVYHGGQTLPASQLPPAAEAAWLAWYATTPDTPCIAVCSTSQGDAVCKGCGRTEGEVQHWLSLSPAAKRAVWHRITAEGTALRFQARYASRARLSAPPGAETPPPRAAPPGPRQYPEAPWGCPAQRLPSPRCDALIARCEGE